MAGKNPEGVTVRQRLLQGAIDLFDRKGYAATTVREIVASAGVTKPVLYYYFRNKEGIYLELMRESFGQLDELLQASRRETGSASRRLLRLCDRLFCLSREKIQVVRLMHSIYYGPHQGAPFFDFDAYHLQVIETIRGLVAEGVRSGEFRRRQAEEMAWALVGALNVAIEVQLGSSSRMSIEREGLARILKTIFQGIQPARKTRGVRP